jgi:hypothetical protein
MPHILTWQNSASHVSMRTSLMKTKIHLLVSGTVPLTLALSLAAQTPSPSPANQTNRPIPFHGMVSAVDQKDRTFTIRGKGATRVFKVTDKTSITKGTGTAKFADIVENLEVSGAYWKNPDGILEAKMIRLGPTERKMTTPPAKPSPTPKPSLPKS